jgi:hypothetical protein
MKILHHLPKEIQRATGVTWTKIVNGIAADHFTRAIREDFHRPGMLYAATERGVMVSYDDGANWTSLQKNLPPVPVYRLNGQTQPTFTYRLPADSLVVKFEFYDAAGKLVGTAASNDTTKAPVDPRFEGMGVAPPAPPKPANKKGVNRFSYTMKHDDAKTFRGMITWAGRGNGPSMAPGMYRVRMTAGNSAPVSYDFRVLPDPRSEATEADLKEQVRFALQVRDKITAANQGVIESRNIKSALTDRAPKMASVPAFAPLAKSFADSLLAVEDSL